MTVGALQNTRSIDSHWNCWLVIDNDVREGMLKMKGGRREGECV
ncbi:hypothetical protein C5S31_01060 [ANME-1 cluster archaeon GoMg2]|nr:hypothetical protein [ANME-1 cluster archaeon GoMg2]